MKCVETNTLLDIKKLLIQKDAIFTNDNIFIGLDLSEEQRSQVMKLPFFVILQEQFNNKRLGQDKIIKTNTTTTYTSLKRKSITILVKTYQQTSKVNDKKISSQEIINIVCNGIIKIIEFSPIVCKIEDMVMIAGSKNTTGNSGFIKYQGMIRLSYNYLSTITLEDNNTFDIKNIEATI